MKIMVIAAHPDDEVLGCGGTIAALSQDNPVKVLILGEGITSRGMSELKQIELKNLWESSERANKILGTNKLIRHNFPDQRMDTVPFLDVVQKIENHLDPDTDLVFTHSVNDLNLDHTITARAVLTATRPMGKKLRGVYSFEVPSSTEWSFGQNGTFQPNVFFDITTTIERKIIALKEYSGEIRLFPHPRSEGAVRASAAYRGSHIGVLAAEAFKLIWSKLP